MFEWRGATFPDVSGHFGSIEAKVQGDILEVGRINEKGLDTKPKNRYKPLKLLKISVYLMTS